MFVIFKIGCKFIYETEHLSAIVNITYNFVRFIYILNLFFSY